MEETQPIKGRRALRSRPARTLSWMAAQEDTLPLIIGSEEVETVSPRPTLWQRVRVVLLSFIAFLCLLTVTLVASGYFGMRAGERARIERRAAIAEEHYQRGLAQLDGGNYELAIAEFEYVLQLVPDHPLAKQGLAEARARLAARPTPTSQAREGVARDLFTRAKAAYEQEDWPTAARLLNQLRAFDPEYEPEAVKAMLFTSLYNAGMAALAGDSLEEGIFYLDQARQIRPLDDNALRELELARRYLKALGYWGVDWEVCIQQLEALYALAPNYRDVFQRLYQAYVAYGDLWAKQGEMCPAAEQYAQALRLMNSEALVQKRDEAAGVCAVATPTPIAPISGILSGTTTVPGFTSGRLAYAAYNAETGRYDIYTLVSDGTNGYLSRVAEGADQPCWRWGGGQLIFRDRLAPGLALLQPDGSRVLLRPGADAAWPTLSPDGSRYAFAAPDSAGVWHIYIARTDGSGSPAVVAPGWGPSWGPTGLLAWTGCEADGSACGIYVDHPDDTQPPTRLTGSASDTGIHWAPGGGQMLYMSDHTGNWDLYLLGVGGGVQVLLSTPAIDGLPAWSPDGATIAFLSYRENTWGIYLMSPDGSNIRPLVTLGAEMPHWPNQRLSWAP
ncbi:MAG: hypothetical protein N0A03_08305 [Anaerolineae bacterium]|nr:hypothetical protein [Anaerolineae bacterium]